ncbi:glycosyltransferase family 4 protein [Pelagovum pacificum]|uniref:Glycosyltransferase family 4 protein n=1 Tax=Pelagovum pacificum TaxID=2588711 RepID=A0A5C5GH68_9RHOB|nr:glycosyltransferase family 4 protein [Pelagovum pacificum]QQA42731.1 glycosyltransferase family 4 protein [Pelagovum pacificum]TNY34118.1 glycosyltransferase family 4 protein [Pelagovum pacificum]
MPHPDPAIFFHPDAIESVGKGVVGRRSAGQSFLKGWLAHCGAERLSLVTEHANASRELEKLLREMGETRPLDIRTLRGPTDFTAFGTIFFPAPGYMNAAWRRQHFAPQACSLVGITHTVSTRRVMEGLHNLLAEPVEPWDALICTSRAVQSVVRRQFDLEAEYYRQRFGASRVPMPRLPLIPLGVNAADFTRDDRARAGFRQRYDVSEDGFVVLSMGRLTSVEKANMVPLLQVLERMSGKIGRPIHFWMAGWASRDTEKALHERAAKDVAPNVTVRIIDGQDPDVRRRIWSAADVFSLPVDNIQETFGLVPVEAMAAGLPVVMPDWNGFRDTVLHDETGFLIPTRMAPPGYGTRVAERFAEGTDDYLRHLSVVQQHTAIDQGAYEAALTALAGDEGLRRQMGAAAVRHVKQRFDWSAVIPQYLALADDLAERRKGAHPTTPKLASGPAGPLEVDPFDLYSDYPTDVLKPTDVVRLVSPIDRAAMDALDEVNGRKLYKRKIISDDVLQAVQAVLSQSGPMEVSTLAGRLRVPLTGVIPACLLLAKFGALALPETSPRP